jgi:hypothetical protein
MNTQELADQIVEQITRAVLGSPLREEPHHVVLVRCVMQTLDQVLAEQESRIPIMYAKGLKS